MERLPDGSVWRDVVDVFEITGHPQTDCCYGWVELIGGRCVWTTRLKVPPVKSAQTAVRAVLMRRARDSACPAE